jgi:hypothetical protein
LEPTPDQLKEDITDSLSPDAIRVLASFKSFVATNWKEAQLGMIGCKEAAVTGSHGLLQHNS